MSEPTFQFRGVWTPAVVLKMVKNDEISAKDFVLLSLIDAMVSDSGQGCWASNLYLANSLGVTKRHLLRMIAKLKDLKLLRVKTEKKKRTLETTWSRPEKGVTRKVTGDPEGHPSSSLSLYTKYKAQETHRRGPGADPVLKAHFNQEETMPFRPVQDKPKNKPNEFDLKQADELHSAVVDILKIKKEGWTRLRLSWAKELMKLRLKLTEAEERISSAVTWYKAHCNEKGFEPRVSGAKHFVKVFDWVERLAERDKRKSVEVSEQAKTILKRLKMMRWPKDSKEELGAAVQASLDSLCAFQRGLRKVRDHLQKSSDESTKRFIASVSARTGHPENFVENWFTSVWASIKNWDEWNGDLMRLAFDHTSPKFQKMGKGWASAWGELKQWTKLMERINAD